MKETQNWLLTSLGIHSIGRTEQLIMLVLSRIFRFEGRVERHVGETMRMALLTSFYSPTHSIYAVSTLSLKLSSRR